jgi:hypothetical protein
MRDAEGRWRRARFMIVGSQLRRSWWDALPDTVLWIAAQPPFTVLDERPLSCAFCACAELAQVVEVSMIAVYEYKRRRQFIDVRIAFTEPADPSLP